MMSFTSIETFRYNKKIDLTSLLIKSVLHENDQFIYGVTNEFVLGDETYTFEYVLGVVINTEYKYRLNDFYEDGEEKTLSSQTPVSSTNQFAIVLKATASLDATTITGLQ